MAVAVVTVTVVNGRLGENLLERRLAWSCGLVEARNILCSSGNPLISSEKGVEC